MILGCVALMISSLIGGLSHNVIAYVIAAMVLGSTSRSAPERWTALSMTLCSRRQAQMSYTKGGLAGFVR